jgi:hypothetical protein
MVIPPLGAVRSPAPVHRRSDRQHRPVRPPTPGTKVLGLVSGTHGHVRVAAVKLSASTLPGLVLKVKEGRQTAHCL